MADSPHPTSAHAPGAPVARNQLALASFLLSLIFPVAVPLNALNAGYLLTPFSSALAFVLRPLGYILFFLSAPALITAIVAGHIALSQAKWYQPRQARRGLAIAALTLGYISLVVFLGVVGLIIWIMVHPIRPHIVF